MYLDTIIATQVLYRDLKHTTSLFDHTYLYLESVEAHRHEEILVSIQEVPLPPPHSHIIVMESDQYIPKHKSVYFIIHILIQEVQ